MDAALVSPEAPKNGELKQRVETLEELVASIEEQLVELAKKGRAPAKPPTSPRPNATPPVKLSDVPTLPSAKQNWCSVNGGQKFFSTKAIEVTVEALRQLAEVSDAVLPQIEAAMMDSFATKKKKVIKRRWIAQSREELYENPKLLASSIEIVAGWWLGTNYSNGDKRDMLATAASVAQQFDIQLDFNLI